MLLFETQEAMRKPKADAEMRAYRSIRESHHNEGGLPWLDDLFRDVRYAARVLLNSRGFTAIAVTSLALAIGATTTIFSVAKQLLYERLAVPQAVDLRLLTWTGFSGRLPLHGWFVQAGSRPGEMITSPDFSYPVYQQLRAHNRVLGDLAAFHITGMNAKVGEDPQRVGAHEVSGNFYAVLGIQPQLGRGIAPSDDTPASQAVVVISDGFWAREFGRSPAALGQWMRLNDVPVRIVGVNPKSYTGPQGTLPSDTPEVTVALAKATILTPSSSGHSWVADPRDGGISIMGRTRAGVSDSIAQEELNTEFSAIVRDMIPVRGGEEIPKLVLRDGSRGLFRQRRTFATPMSALLLFVGLVLLLACANIANLMLARGARRRREMSVRLALGAGCARILRQLLAESILLAAMGGGAGLAIGYFGRTAIRRLTQNAWEPATLPIHFDGAVVAFTVTATVLTGILFGLAPALAATRTDVVRGLEGGRTATRRRKGFAGKALTGFQIALSTLLLIGAGLFVRSVAALTAVEPGFRTDHLLLAEIVLPQNRYPAGANVAFHQRLERAIASIPGVDSVSAAAVPYLSLDSVSTEFWPEDEARDPNLQQTEPYVTVGIHFFETMGIRIVAGRAFGVQDTANSTKVGIINQTLAGARFPNGNPIGKTFSVAVHAGYGDVLSSVPIEIVGVCADTLYRDLNEPPPPQFFVPYQQQTSIRRLTYEVRTRITPGSMIAALRGTVHAADPEIPVVHVRTQQQQIDADLEQDRLFVTLTSAFGVLALVLASVGIYGVMAYSVAQRTNEIGIRLALGASPRQVLAMVLREALWLAAVGIGTGAGGAFLAGHLVKSMLYGVAPYDPAALSAAAILLLAVALGASWIPGRRAAGVQPMDALRRD